jgi:hypothetical protein
MMKKAHAHHLAALPLVEGLEQRLVSCEVRKLALGDWDVCPAYVWLEVALTDLGEEPRK